MSFVRCRGPETSCGPRPAGPIRGSGREEPRYVWGFLSPVRWLYEVRLSNGRRYVRLGVAAGFLHENHASGTGDARVGARRAPSLTRRGRPPRHSHSTLLRTGFVKSYPGVNQESRGVPVGHPLSLRQNSRVRKSPQPPISSPDTPPCKGGAGYELAAAGEPLRAQGSAHVGFGVRQWRLAGDSPLVRQSTKEGRREGGGC